MLDLTVLNDLPVDLPVALRAQLKEALESAYAQGLLDGGRPMATLMGLLDKAYSGENIPVEMISDRSVQLTSVCCSMRSQYKGARTVEATLTWEDETDGPLALVAALEQMANPD